MTTLKRKISNPMTIIAIFATLSETSAAVSLPFLDNDEREIYIWFLISFPFYLLFLFFATLNFNYRSLYAPSDFKEEKHFIKILDDPEHPKNDDSTIPFECTTRLKVENGGQAASHPDTTKARQPRTGIQSAAALGHHIRLPELLERLYLIDVRQMSKKMEFSTLLETIKKSQEKHSWVMVFLTCAKSQPLLKESVLRHVKRTKKRGSTAFFVAYNLDSHAMTLIDERCPPTHDNRR